MSLDSLSELEKLRAMMGVLFDHNPDGVCISDAAGNMLTNYGYRVLNADWGIAVKSEFVVPIVVTGIDTGPGVINRLTDRIYNLGINIRAFSIEGEGGYFLGNITLLVKNTDELNQAMTALRAFDWVKSVVRKEDNP